MQDVHLREFDLNLLVVLQALLAERSVTRTAERIGLTQPAVSHALARLRKRLGDPLLVRSPRGMELTPRAKAMTRPLDRALADLRQAVAPPPAFDPARATRNFRIAADDYLELVLLPALLTRLWHEAPGIDIGITAAGARSGHDLAEGTVDAVIAPLGVIGRLSGAYTQHLFDERFVCLVRAGHPAVGDELTLELFLTLPHALVAPGGRPGSIVDAALARIGRKRRVAIEIPHFLAAPPIVRQSDAIVTLGERVARANRRGLRLFEPPLALPGFSVSLFWHERDHADPSHIWFRRKIAEAARRL